MCERQLKKRRCVNARVKKRDRRIKDGGGRIAREGGVQIHFYSMIESFCRIRVTKLQLAAEIVGLDLRYRPGNKEKAKE